MYRSIPTLIRRTTRLARSQAVSPGALWSVKISSDARAGLVTFRNVRSWAIHVESRELPRRCALPADVVVGCRRLDPIGCPRRTSSGDVGGREPVSAKAVGPLPGAEGQAATGRRCHALDDGGSESMVRLARRAGECAGGHAPALAPPGIPPLLALEVADGRADPAYPTTSRR